MCSVNRTQTGSIEDIQIVSGGSGYALHDRIITKSQEKGHSFSGVVEDIDSSGNYLSIPVQESLQLETGNFTLECWIYPTHTLINQTLCSTYNKTSGSGWSLGIDGGNNLVFDMYRNTVQRCKSSFKVLSLRWNHIAVTREANTIRLFINGRLSGSFPIINGFLSSNDIRIGNDYEGHTFIGYMNQLRITKNVVRYTTNFDSSVIRYNDLDIHFSNVSLLLYFEGSPLSSEFIDASSSPKTVTTSGSIYIEQKESVFGTTSAFFSGLGSIQNIRIYNTGYNYDRLPVLQVISKMGTGAELLPQSDSIGSISGLTILSPYIDTDPNTITVSIISQNGTGAVITPIRKTVYKENPEFRTFDGVLGLNSVILDSDYYQQFSYQVQSDISRNEYDAIIDKFIHPVGFIRFALLKSVSAENIKISLNMEQVFVVGYYVSGSFYVGYYENEIFIVLKSFDTQEEADEYVQNIEQNYSHINPVIENEYFVFLESFVSGDDATQYIQENAENYTEQLQIIVFDYDLSTHDLSIFGNNISIRSYVSDYYLFNPIFNLHWFKEIRDRFTNWVSGFDWIQEETTYEDKVMFSQALDSYKVSYTEFFETPIFLFNQFLNIDFYKNSELFTHPNSSWDTLLLNEIDTQKYFSEALDINVSVVI